MKNVKIGILGSGGRIRGVVKNTLKAGEGKIEVAAFYDISEQAVNTTQETFPGIQKANSIDELLNNRELEWIFIGSYNAAHKEHALAAMEAGKNIFLEKPIATTLEDVLAIREAAKKYNKKIVIGFVLRYSIFYKKLKSLLCEEGIGKIISFEFNETLDPNHGAAMHGNWRRLQKFGGTFLLEKCCHDIDIMLWMTETRPARVASFGGCNFFKPENENIGDLLGKNEEGDSYYKVGLATGKYVGKEKNITPFNSDKDTIDNQVAILEMENGVRATFHLCAHAALKERRFYICGTKGAIRADLLTGNIEMIKTGWDQPKWIYRPIEGDGHGGADPILGSELSNAILNGYDLPTGVKEGVASALTCFGIDEAMNSGCVVDMKRYWDL